MFPEGVSRFSAQRGEDRRRWGRENTVEETTKIFKTEGPRKSHRSVAVGTTSQDEGLDFWVED